VVGFLLLQVQIAAGKGNLDDQLGSSDEIVIRVNSALSAKLCRNEQKRVRLRLSVQIELDGRAIRAPNSRRETESP
jgi:hypothetical protein